MLLLSFIGSIAACGLVGVYALTIGQFGSLEVRVLLSTTALGGASIVAMASAVSWEARRWPWIGVIGMTAAGLALAGFLLLIWDVLSYTDQELAFRITMSVAVVAVSAAHTSLLGMARLNRGYEWVRLGTLAAIVILATFIIFIIAFEPVNSGTEIARIMGVIGICNAVGTIATPILHRISRIRTVEQTVTTQLMLTLTCPRCGKTQQQPAGASRCECGLRFRIDIEEEHCQKCGYSLYRLTGDHCPECGTPIHAASPPPAPRV